MMKVAVVFRPREYFYYDLDWRDAFLKFKEIDAKTFEYSIANLKNIKEILRSDVIIFLHSVDLGYPVIDYKILQRILKYRSGKLVYFPRNEFKNFVPKRKFIQQSHVDLVASQLPLKSADYLYGDLADVISMPHALNPEIFKLKTKFGKRKITMGGRSVKYPSHLIDNSRNRVDKLLKSIAGLKPNYKVNYSTDEKDRFNRKGWSKFLNNCKFTVSTEAGASYVDKSDKLQKQIGNYILKYPNDTGAKLVKRFMNRISSFPSGRCISSRHFEAIGCGTCQILIEGRYSGLLKPNIHYIELKKDLSNIEEVLLKMEDQKYVRNLVDSAYTLVAKEHTYLARINTLVNKFQEF